MNYLVSLLVGFFLLSCIDSKNETDKIPLDQPQEELADYSRIDSLKYSKSKAIIRGKLIEFGEGNKYLYPKIQVLDVIMNSTDFKFQDTIKVAHYNSKAGVPENKECIIYLTSWPYESDQLNENQDWMLLEGDGEYACECN